MGDTEIRSGTQTRNPQAETEKNALNEKANSFDRESKTTSEDDKRNDWAPDGLRHVLEGTSFGATKAKTGKLQRMKFIFILLFNDSKIVKIIVISIITIYFILSACPRSPSCPMAAPYPKDLGWLSF